MDSISSVSTSATGYNDFSHSLGKSKTKPNYNSSFNDISGRKYRTIKPAVPPFVSLPLLNYASQIDSALVNKTDACISIENCKLNTIDSHSDNVVIVLKDYFNESSSGNKNESEIEEILFSSQNQSDENEDSNTIFYDKCIICGKSAEDGSLNKLGHNICKEKLTAIDSLTAILDSKEIDCDNVLCATDDICTHCVEVLEEIDVLKQMILKKEQYVIDNFKRRKGSYVLKDSPNNLNEFNVKLEFNDEDCAKNNNVITKIEENKFKNYDECLGTMNKFLPESDFLHHSKNFSNSENLPSSKVLKRCRGRLKKKRGFSCNICHANFSNAKNLASHSSKEHSRSTFDCQVCGRFLTTEARLLTHMKKFHNIGEEKSKSVSCNLCDKTFHTKAGLRYHRNVAHQTGTKYECKHCMKIYYNIGLYRSHILFAHSEKRIVCETCGAMFFTVSKLNTHMNAVHRKSLTWHCVECDVRFTTGTAFRSHRAKHKSKLNCFVCSLQFLSKFALQNHMKDHSLFVCKVCSKHFSNEKLLTDHVFIEHKENMSSSSRRRKINSLNKIRKGKSSAQNSSRKQSKRLLDIESTEPLQVDIDDLLLANSFNENNALQSFDNSIDIEDSSGKIRSFSLLNTAHNCEISSDNCMHVQNDDVSFINVEILDNIEISEATGATLSNNGAEFDLSSTMNSITGSSLQHSVDSLVQPVESLSPSTLVQTDDLEATVHDLVPSVSEFGPSVDIEQSTSTLESSDKNLDHNAIWHLSNLHGLPSNDIVDLDIGVIEGDIVSADVIAGADDVVNLGIKDTDDLSNLDVNIDG